MSEILEKVESAPTKEQKIKLLQENSSQQLRDVIQGCFDARIVWLLPEGPVPFKPLDGENSEKVFWAECRKLYLFVRGGNPNLKQTRRETLFIQLLEAINVKDANLLVAIKDKVLPFPSITYELIKEAWNIDYPKYIAEKSQPVELNPSKPKLNIAPEWNDDIPPAVVQNQENDKAVEDIIQEAFRVTEEDKINHKKEMRRLAAQKRREKARDKRNAEEFESVENTEA